MRWIWIVLYTALALGANAAGADRAALEALREGTMLKLNFHSQAKDVPADQVLLDLEGHEHRLSDFRGKVVLLNFWATWCAPCRKEMPALDALQAELGGDQFEVVTVAVGRHAVPAIRRFFSEVGVEHVTALRDPTQSLARQMGVFGLPNTLILDADGKEIARMQGDAEWDSDSARAIIAALLEKDGA